MKRTISFIILTFGLCLSVSVEAFDYYVAQGQYASVDFSPEYFFKVNPPYPEPIGIEVFSYDSNKVLIDVTEATRYYFTLCDFVDGIYYGRCAEGILPSSFKYRMYLYYYGSGTTQLKTLCQINQNGLNYCVKPPTTAGGAWGDACWVSIPFGFPACGTGPDIAVCPQLPYVYDIPYDKLCGGWNPFLIYKNEGTGKKINNINSRMKGYGERGIGGYEKNY